MQMLILTIFKKTVDVRGLHRNLRMALTMKEKYQRAVLFYNSKHTINLHY